MNEPTFRFTHDPGSALLYYGDEFVAKFSSKHCSAFAAIIAANDIMREEIDAFTKHVGAPTFQEAVDVSRRSHAENMDAAQRLHDQVKGIAARLRTAEDIIQRAMTGGLNGSDYYSAREAEQVGEDAREFLKTALASAPVAAGGACLRSDDARGNKASAHSRQ